MNYRRPCRAKPHLPRGAADRMTEAGRMRAAAHTMPAAGKTQGGGRMA